MSSNVGHIENAKLAIRNFLNEKKEEKQNKRRTQELVAVVVFLI
jgi:hypothetical protein